MKESRKCCNRRGCCKGQERRISSYFWIPTLFRIPNGKLVHSSFISSSEAARYSTVANPWLNLPPFLSMIFCISTTSFLAFGRAASQSLFSNSKAFSGVFAMLFSNVQSVIFVSNRFALSIVNSQFS